MARWQKGKELKTLAFFYFSRDFVLFFFSTQKQHENIWNEFAQKIARSQHCDGIVLMDRGLIDGSVYVSEEEFNECLHSADLPSLSSLYTRSFL